jgi:hypothetical protein
VWTPERLRVHARVINSAEITAADVFAKVLEEAGG